MVSTATGPAGTRTMVEQTGHLSSQMPLSPAASSSQRSSFAGRTTGPHPGHTTRTLMSPVIIVSSASGGREVGRTRRLPAVDDGRSGEEDVDSVGEDPDGAGAGPTCG